MGQPKSSSIEWSLFIAKNFPLATYPVTTAIPGEEKHSADWKTPLLTRSHLRSIFDIAR